MQAKQQAESKANMTLCISGYRNFIDYPLFKTTLDNFIKENGEPSIMLFGECTGTDKMALTYCNIDIHKPLNHKIYYADWKKHGLKGGPLRNEEMLKLSTHLLAFLHDESKGTKNAIATAKKYNVKTTVVNITSL